ncbi:MAG: methionine adenosyltransferase, partial [bacterium]
FRYQDDYRITMCVPQISSLVFSVNEYRKNLDLIKNEILKIAMRFDITNLELDINTRDSYEKGEFYLTATGSSIESGDEGLVGRGNRIQGVISPTRLMSMEGAAGKNPIYHIGKIYYLAAQKISKSIFDKYGVPNEVVLISQSGRDLLDPWIVFVHIPDNSGLTEDDLKNHVKEGINKIPSYSEDLIHEKVSIF